MSQKSNPLNLRLGILNLWTFSIQNYGNNNFNSFYLFYKQKKIINFINKFFYLNNIIINYKEFWWGNNIIFCNIYCFKLSKKLIYLDFVKNLSFLINKWQLKNIFIRLYFTENWYSCSFLSDSYLKFLFKKNYSPRKILGILSIFLIKQINLKKIIYLKNGPKIIELKGFKIKLKGRFENSSNQMSKTSEYKFGSLTLTTLNNHVNYINNHFNTKLGVCSLKIWLFFNIKSKN